MKIKRAYEQVELQVVIFESDVITTSGLEQQVFDDDNVITWF